MKIVVEVKLKRHYRKLSLKHHPDRGGDAEEFKKINEAYSTLGDTEKKTCMICKRIILLWVEV